MLNSDNLQGWAQIGFIAHNTVNNDPAYGWDSNDFFMQWTRNQNVSTVQTLFWGNPGSGGSWKFQATREASDGFIHLLKDGSTQWTTDFDPLDVWAGRQTQFFSEIHHVGDDFFGTSGNRTDFASVQSKTVSGWQNQNWNLSGTALCFGHVHEFTSNSHFESWTSPLDHQC